MSKPAGRNNSKIITRNQGGGNKKQGLAPLATQFFISQANNVQYRTESGDGRSRDLVVCVNQLGGIGKGRSQFRANADGKRGAECEDDLTLQYITEIQAYLQGEITRMISISHSNNIKTYNMGNNFKLCYVGKPENVSNDINSVNNPNVKEAFDGAGGEAINTKIFTHLYSPFSNDNLKIYLINNVNGISNEEHSITILPSYKDKINYVNERVPDNFPFFLKSTNPQGVHTLGLINLNFQFNGNNIIHYFNMDGIGTPLNGIQSYPVGIDLGYTSTLFSVEQFMDNNLDTETDVCILSPTNSVWNDFSWNDCSYGLQIDPTKYSKITDNLQIKILTVIDRPYVNMGTEDYPIVVSISYDRVLAYKVWRQKNTQVQCNGSNYFYFGLNLTPVKLMQSRINDIWTTGYHAGTVDQANDYLTSNQPWNYDYVLGGIRGKRMMINYFDISDIDISGGNS